MAVVIIYFPVASAFLDGLRHSEPALSGMARGFGATPRQVLFRIRLPAALPSLGSGLRLAAVYAPIGAVIGEWVGASQGLGYLMLLANGRAKTDRSEEHTSELQSLMRISYAVFFLKKKKKK